MASISNQHENGDDDPSVVEPDSSLEADDAWLEGLRDRIRWICKHRNVSPSRLSQLAGRSASHLNLLLNPPATKKAEGNVHYGKNISARVVRSIAQAGGVRVSWLMDGEEPREDGGVEPPKVHDTMNAASATKGPPERPVAVDVASAKTPRSPASLAVAAIDWEAILRGSPGLLEALDACDTALGEETVRRAWGIRHASIDFPPEIWKTLLIELERRATRERRLAERGYVPGRSRSPVLVGVEPSVLGSGPGVASPEVELGAIDVDQTIILAGGTLKAAPEPKKPG